MTTSCTSLHTDRTPDRLTPHAGPSARTAGEECPAGPDGPRTSWLTDPDGYQIELVQWPAGHADGITAADLR